MQAVFRLKSIARLIGLMAAVCVVCAGVAQAKFYRFVDEQGRVHFVDDLSKVPDLHLEELEEYKERYDHLPPQERAVRLRQEQEAAAAIEEQLRLEELEAEQGRRQRAEAAARRKALEARREQQETKVVVQGNQILVPVLLGYDGKEIEGRMLLDTGASSIVLHREIAQRLNLKPTQRGKAQVVGGQRIATELAELSYLTVGPFSAKKIPVLIVSHDGPPVSFDGLLGMNFLRQVKYSVDYQNQVIRWLP